MIRINLLPFRAARSKEAINRQLSLYIGILIILAALLTAGNWWAKKIITQKQMAVNKIKQEVKEYEAITKEINEIKSQLNLLQKKTGVIENLEKSRHESVQLMEMMSDTPIEGRMWLTSLETKVTERKPPKTNDKKKKKKVNEKKPENIVALPPLKSLTLQGLALDNKTVADFMTRLEQIKSPAQDKQERSHYSKVKLKTLKQYRLDENINLKQFNLELTESMPKAPTTNNKGTK